MKLIQLLTNLFCVAALLLIQVEGLAFVTAIVNPVATLRAVNPIRIFSGAGLPKESFVLQSHSGVASTKGLLSDEKPKADDDDVMVRVQRSQMVDLVYERSLERMNSFATE